MAEKIGIVQWQYQDATDQESLVYSKVYFRHSNFHGIESPRELQALRCREVELVSTGQPFQCAVVSIYFNQDSGSSPYIPELIHDICQRRAVIEDENSKGIILSFRPPYFDDPPLAIQTAMDCAMHVLEAYEALIPGLRIALHSGALSYMALPHMNDGYNLMGLDFIALIYMHNYVVSGNIIFADETEIASYFKAHQEPKYRNWSSTIQDISKEKYNFYKHIYLIKPTKS